MDATRAPRWYAVRQAFPNSVFAFCAFLFECRPSSPQRAGQPELPVRRQRPGQREVEVGQASCVLAETPGSLGSARHAGLGRVTVGIEISATHHRAASAGR